MINKCSPILELTKPWERVKSQRCSEFCCLGEMKFPFYFWGILPTLFEITAWKNIPYVIVTRMLSLIPCWEQRSARTKIECAYGRLKARWQILTKAMNFQMKDNNICVFVMHNYCELNNTALDEQGVQRFMDFERENEQAGSRIYSTSTVGGALNRSVLTDYFIAYNFFVWNP